MHNSINRPFNWIQNTANNLNTIKISYSHVRIRNSFYILVLENYCVKTPTWRSFSSPLFSDSAALSSYTFEVSNIYNCNNIGVYCLNAY